ncbi:aminotransferase class I/II-fold pyridoxal phosphate-dependent enzyme, partial [Erwinia amylovora]|uniref:aminotransferase class I/II-fold pyridoxal phosphate-dependent enzyme n=1 Tax=Erwinia amylovora TaxID=552 RepID=UPI00200B153E
ITLQALTDQGDWVAIEKPSFYGALQAIERLKLKSVANATDPQTGIDLDELERALERWPIKALWMMTNQQNPVGCTISREKKQRLVELLALRGVSLIEDDVYSELYFGC